MGSAASRFTTLGLDETNQSTTPDISAAVQTILHCRQNQSVGMEPSPTLTSSLATSSSSSPNAARPQLVTMCFPVIPARRVQVPSPPTTAYHIALKSLPHSHTISRQLQSSPTQSRKRKHDESGRPQRETADQKRRRLLPRLKTEQISFRLFDLPPELRYMIYGHLITGPGRSISIGNKPRFWRSEFLVQPSELQSQMMRVSKPVYNEMYDLLYHKTTFKFNTTSTAVKFLAPTIRTPLANSTPLKRLRRVEITEEWIPTTGKKFARSLLKMPNLLSVTLPESFVRQVEAGQAAELERVLQNWFSQNGFPEVSLAALLSLIKVRPRRDCPDPAEVEVARKDIIMKYHKRRVHEWANSKQAEFLKGVLFDGRAEDIKSVIRSSSSDAVDSG